MVMHGCPPALFFVADCRAGLTGGLAPARDGAVLAVCGSGAGAEGISVRAEGLIYRMEEMIYRMEGMIYRMGGWKISFF
mgnify:CR=1 FL=1